MCLKPFNEVQKPVWETNCQTCHFGLNVLRSAKEVNGDRKANLDLVTDSKRHMKRMRTNKVGSGCCSRSNSIQVWL